MMKIYIGWLFLLLFILFSCQKETEVSIETGSLLVYATQNNEVHIKTKTALVDQPIRIAICNAISGDTVRFFNSYNEDLGLNKIDLPIGQYYVKASTETMVKAAFEKPFYYGVDTVQVKVGYIVEAEVECILANAKVTVAYSDMLKEYFLGYKATISNSSGSLIFEEDEARAGYYLPEKLRVELNLINNDGTPYRIIKELPNVKAREHYRLTFSIGEEPENPEAGGDFEVTVDENTNDINCELKVPVFTDDYGRNMPKIISSIKEQGNSLDIKETNPNAIKLTSDISAKRGISVLAIKLVSSYFNSTEGLPKYIDLMEADASMITKLNNIGITGIDNFVGDVKINFDVLLGNLPINNDGKEATHTIGLLVRDNLGQQVEDTMVVNVRSNVAIEVKSSGWSRFAYLHAVLSTNENVRIKYREKSTLTWTDQAVLSNEIQQTNEGNYILERKIIGLKEITNYEYIIIAGQDEATGEFATSHETPLQNPGFEDWTAGAIWYPGIAGQDFWDCGNSSTMGINANFTTPLEPGRDGSTRVAQLRSQFAGFGSIGKFGAGNIFTGTFDLDGMNGELDLGRSYTSRPSALKGYYKYKPENVTYSSSHIAIGVKDTCSIYVVLTSSIIEVRTKTGKFFSKDDPSIIAYAELSKANTSETTGNGYHEFSLPLIYRDLYTEPKYIIIVCSSSKYGDYFAGGEGSTLWLDDFSLDFSE